MSDFWALKELFFCDVFNDFFLRIVFFSSFCEDYFKMTLFSLGIRKNMTQIFF